ncbi:MAG TPA: zinc ribbon domain-containing protein [Thermomicrobiales bacterium]|nr:zinc ribbon domain-containing protein [Thermomicrobiales bacterium]
MIDSMPLDLFEDDTIQQPEPAAALLALCQWCGVEHPADDGVCPDCGATLLRQLLIEPEAPAVEQPQAPTVLTECPWCDQPVTPDDTECPHCFAVLLGDPNLVLPGVNVPLHDNVLWARTLAEREAGQDEDPTGTIVDLLLVVGEALLKTRGRM